jgi:hypothetical protein
LNTPKFCSESSRLLPLAASILSGEGRVQFVSVRAAIRYVGSDAEDPSETAARNHDWQAFLATLAERTLAILNCLAHEIPLQTVAEARVAHRQK